MLVALLIIFILVFMCLWVLLSLFFYLFLGIQRAGMRSVIVALVGHIHLFVFNFSLLFLIFVK